MSKTIIGKPRGIINHNGNDLGISHSQNPPSDDLSFFVQHYWIVEWDLTDREPHVAQTLPHPNVHLVFEKGKTKISGIHTEKFTRTLEERGEVFGVKFKSGGFFPFLKSPVSEISNKVIDFDSVFGSSPDKLETEIFNKSDKSEKIKVVEDFLRGCLPERDQLVPYLSDIVETINSDQSLIKVENVCEKFSVSKRKLERLFSQYVGVTPKWVIKRYRLHEALDQLKNKDYSDLTELALSLGYYDQPHFIKDFKMIIGKSPMEYVKG